MLILQVKQKNRQFYLNQERVSLTVFQPIEVGLLLQYLGIAEECKMIFFSKF